MDVTLRKSCARRRFCEFNDDLLAFSLATLLASRHRRPVYPDCQAERFRIEHEFRRAGATARPRVLVRRLTIVNSFIFPRQFRQRAGEDVRNIIAKLNIQTPRKVSLFVIDGYYIINYILYNILVYYYIIFITLNLNRCLDNVQPPFLML